MSLFLAAVAAFFMLVVTIDVRNQRRSAVMRTLLVARRRNAWLWMMRARLQSKIDKMEVRP